MFVCLEYSNKDNKKAAQQKCYAHYNYDGHFCDWHTLFNQTQLISYMLLKES
jgi:hypothetical protein